MPPKSKSSRRLISTGTPGIYKRGGRYVVRWRDRQGKQHQRAAATLAEARVIRGERVSSVGRGERQPQSKPIPFDTHARNWVETTQVERGTGCVPTHACRVSEARSNVTQSPTLARSAAGNRPT